MAVLNIGSINIDHVYGVDHVARPGETIAGDSYRVFAGGKGANQSAALALAGARVFHAGRVGTDGRWLLEGLTEIGVDVTQVVIDDEEPTGHAVIQVEERSGENAIFLFAGSNHRVTGGQITTCLENFNNNDILLLQNEINDVGHVLSAGSDRGLMVCLNPAPYGPEVAGYPLDLVDLLILNRMEAAGLAGIGAHEDAGALLDGLRRRFPGRTEILLTLGDQGAVLDGRGARLSCPAAAADCVVDTTGAGDTFIGYFLAGRAAGNDDGACLRRAAAASAMCVSRPGARASIPTADEVESTMESEAEA